MKIFISYSWTSPTHEEWVLTLATKLREDGVDVVLDKWDLKEGHDIYAFMEGMANDLSIDKVLIICDEKYKEKANLRKQGAGVEAQIITSQIYSQIKQEKFIPIIAQKDASNNPCLPTYLENRKYIDLSSEETFSKEYERLLRNLYQKPEFQKPALGAAPEWLETQEINHYKTSNVLKDLNHSLDRNPKRIKGLLRKFSKDFFELSSSFVYVQKIGVHVDEEIKALIERMLPLRNDFIKFLEFQCENNELDVDILVKFFEEYYALTHANGKDLQNGGQEFDHFRFMIRELYIYAVIVMLEHEKYGELADFIKNEYFIEKYVGETLSHHGYEMFRLPIQSLVKRNERLKLNRISIDADILIARAYLPRYDKDKIVNVDLLLYYLSIILRPNTHSWWFPVAYIYSRKKIPLMQKLVSKKHFERVREIFNVRDSQALVHVLGEFQNKYENGYPGAFETIPPITYHIDLKSICTTY